MAQCWRSEIRGLAFFVLVIFNSQFALAGELDDRQHPLVGQLLVASPSMADPRFVEAVVLMVQHSSQGALGLVINKPILEIGLDQIADEFGFVGAVADSTAKVHFGGPVELNQIFVVHSSDYSSDSTIFINDAIGISGDQRALLDTFGSGGPKQFIIVMGYAGWGSGQLEKEIARDDWEIATADRNIILDADYGTKWLRAFRLRLIEL
jgi:putative transcriptional regulator